MEGWHQKSNKEPSGFKTLAARDHAVVFGPLGNHLVKTTNYDNYVGDADAKDCQATPKDLQQYEESTPARKHFFLKKSDSAADIDPYT